jgi:tape measure domain-containing protein
MARTIEAYKLRTELAVDAAKGRRETQAFEKDVGKVESRFKSLGKEITSAMKGADVSAGRKWGENFSSGATSVITGSIKSLGTTIGSIIGTAIAPGIGTAIGSTVGSAVDAALEKVSGPILEKIKGGIELNKLLEQTQIEFTTFAGSEREAKRYLSDLLKMSTDLGILPTVLIDASEKTYDLTNNLKLTRTILRAAADQAADFGGKVETFQDIATQLGLIAEKGEMASRELNKLYKLGIDAPKLLAQATGKSEETIKKWISKGEIDGAVAARLIAEGIERQKAGYARKQAMTSTIGAERRSEALTQVRAAEGTQNATHALGDFYRNFNDVMDSPQAKRFVSFIDEKTGSLINMVEKASRAGVNVAEGLGVGITSGEALKSLGASFTSLGDYTETTLKGVFGIKSPSQRMIDAVGIPLGEGIGVGTKQGMMAYADLHAHDDVEDFIRAYSEAAREAQRKTGVPASVSMAQAILESGAGKSGLTRRAKNFFGIKGKGSAGSVNMRTREETRSGSSYYVNAPFRAYNSADESFLDHGEFLRGPRYRGALQFAGDPKAYAQKIASAGYATDRNYAGKVGGLIDKYGLSRLDVGGAAVSASNPMPVYVAHDIVGGASLIFGKGRKQQPTSFSTSVSFDENSIRVDPVAQMLDLAGKAVPVFEGLAPAIANASGPLLTFDQAMHIASGTLSDFGLGMPLLTKEMLDFGRETRTDLALTTNLLEQNVTTLHRTVGIATQLSVAVGQAGTMLPQQKVGKKRGLFSQILGFAAPFLSFIPGAGPMLSHLAGMASAGLAGNWAGVASGVAAGLQPGGVFHGSGSSPGGGGGAGTTIGSGVGTSGHGGLVHRAAGGPGFRGRTYWTGEHGPEPFMAPSNGYFLNHRDAMSAIGGGGDPAMAGMLERLHGVLARLEGVDPTHVVRMGARGMIDAYDQDAGLIRMSSQRHRLE